MTKPVIQKTPLEYALLRAYYSRYKDVGFPRPEDMQVSSRESSTAGRLVYLDHVGDVRLEDGQLGLGTYSQINLADVEGGASFWVFVEDRKVIYLEIAINGLGSWNGSESGWDICDPNTGIFSTSP